MNKLLSSLGVAIAVATVSLLAGCQLYFGSSGSSGGGGGRGGANGGGGSDGNPPGAQCTMDNQCSAGCFCANGVCTEGGFCATDKDCGGGFHCDTSRSSCIPNPQCTGDAQCKQGSMCDIKSGACVATCLCTNDADAIKAGFGWCDETRNTCMTGTDAGPTFAAAGPMNKANRNAEPNHRAPAMMWMKRNARKNGDVRAPRSAAPCRCRRTTA